MGAKSIKKVLIDQGYTIAGLAKMVGLSREHLSRVINGHCESDCAKAKIAEVLGKATSDLWAQDEDTTPRH